MPSLSDHHPRALRRSSTHRPVIDYRRPRLQEAAGPSVELEACRCTPHPHTAVSVFPVPVLPVPVCVAVARAAVRVAVRVTVPVFVVRAPHCRPRCPDSGLQ